MFTAEYRKKLITPEQAAQKVRSGNWVDYGLGFIMLWTIDRALAARKGELRDVKVRGIMAMRSLAIVENDPERESFRYMSWHLNAYERALNTDTRAIVETARRSCLRSTKPAALPGGREEYVHSEVDFEDVRTPHACRI